MNVTGAGGTQGARPIFAAGSASRPAGASGIAQVGGSRPVQEADEVTISDAARQMQQAAAAEGVTAGNGAHAARLDEIRAQIAAGTYETEQRLSSAVNRMLSDILDTEA